MLIVGLHGTVLGSPANQPAFPSAVIHSVPLFYCSHVPSRAAGLHLSIPHDGTMRLVEPYSVTGLVWLSFRTVVEYKGWLSVLSA